MFYPKLKNKVTLLVRKQVFDRCKEENERLIFAMSERKEVEIWFNSAVTEIHSDRFSHHVFE